MKTLDQIYAEKVYLVVSARSKESNQTLYGTLAQNLPILIHQAGLLQALSFLKTKTDMPHQNLLCDLAKVLGYSKADSLLQACRDADFQTYRLLTQKANIATGWFKRYAQSVLEVDAGNSLEEEY